MTENPARGSSELVTQAREERWKFGFSNVLLPYRLRDALCDENDRLRDRVEELEAELAIANDAQAARISGLIEELDFIGDLRGRVEELEAEVEHVRDERRAWLAADAATMAENNEARARAEMLMHASTKHSAIQEARVSELETALRAGVLIDPEKLFWHLHSNYGPEALTRREVDDALTASRVTEQGEAE